MASAYSLPKLPYAYDALEPVISAQIMELHHSKHHQAYVNNLNAALNVSATAQQNKDVPTDIRNQQAVRFNGGGHINHSLFWHNLTPPNAANASTSAAPQLSEAIEKVWGSEQSFKDTFNAALLGIQGSGWGWLVKYTNENARLGIVTTKDQDPIIGKDEVPVIGIDMWEHAYYLQYLNGKAAYVENIWKVINWQTAEERYLGSQQDAFSVLKAAL